MAPIFDDHELSLSLLPEPENALVVREANTLVFPETINILRIVRGIQARAEDVIKLIGDKPYGDFLRSLDIYKGAIEKQYPDEVIREIQEMVVIQIRTVWILIFTAENDRKEKRRADASIKKAQHLAEINTVLKKENETDPLTNLYNKKGLDIEGTKVFKHCKAKGISLSCLYIDLDYFKTVNDEHGHPVGDAVLKTFAKNISIKFREFVETRFRQYDFSFTQGGNLIRSETGESITPDPTVNAEVVARDGGEEFMVLMPFTDLEEATVAAERFREFIQEESLKFLIPNVELQLTCTIGVSQANFDRDKSIYDLKTNSDDALKQGKKTHRNVVCVTKTNNDGETTYTFPHLKSPRRKAPKPPQSTAENAQRYEVGNPPPGIPFNKILPFE